MAKVRVIDDDPDVRNVIRYILEFDGHEVADAGRGEAGLSRYNGFKPGLVITDNFTPGKDGF